MGVRLVETEKTVQKSVKEVLQLNGYFVSDFSQPRASLQTPGIPDIFAVNPRRGIQLWCEVKRPKGRVTNDQETWHRTVRAAGGRVFVVHSGWEMQEILNALHTCPEA